MILHLATTNPGKLRDFAHALTPGFTLEPLPGLAALPVPDETADTFEGNARIKAIAYSLAAPGLYVLADDSGLEVDALGGAPGIRSARYADDLGFEVETEQSTDQRNNACLQAQMLPHPSQRTARYRCTLALARNGRVLATADGTVEGELLVQPQGSGGFGYDPLFLLTDLQLTMAEIDPAIRRQHSHRARALALLLSQVITQRKEANRKRKTAIVMAALPVAFLAVAALGYLLTLGLMLHSMDVHEEVSGINLSKATILRQVVESVLLFLLCLWAMVRIACSRAALLTCGGIALALLALGSWFMFDDIREADYSLHSRVTSFLYLSLPLLGLAALGLSGTIRAWRSSALHNIAQS